MNRWILRSTGHNRNNVFTISNVEKFLAVPREDKAVGFDSIVCLMLLFNITSVHCFVPDDFDVVITISLVKHE